MSVHPVTPEKRKLKQIYDLLINRKGVLVLPTDSIYGLMTLPSNKKGRERIFRIKQMDKKQHLSLICPNIETASRYARNISNVMFKLLKRSLPGPYTYIFNATKEVPRMFLNKQGSIGIRIPDNAIIQGVLQSIDSPLVSTSVQLGDEWYNDPLEIESKIGHSVDAVIDGGIFPIEPSTIIDGTSGEPEVLREGKGPVNIL
jgi:tRNA threonylcarbamoyl adenosine modification protein (Sua5/YciO/YrdC/YwlC family)